MTSIESSIFTTYKNWKDLDTYGDIVYYDCELANDIGQFKKGQIVQSIALIYSKSIIEFCYVENGVEKHAQFKVSLSIEV